MTLNPKEQVEKALKTSVEHLEDVLNLDSERIEEPWILKNYLNTKITKQGKNHSLIQN